MKLKLIILCIFLVSYFVGPAFGDQFNVIIYCNKRNPEVIGTFIEHWKADIPSLGDGEVVRDFKVLVRSGERLVVHALMDPLGQGERIKQYLRNQNDCVDPVFMGPECTLPVAQQILMWWDRDVFEVYKKLWQDRGTHAVFETIAKRVLEYSVETTCEGEPCTIIVSLTEAEDTYGEVIDPQQILIPHRFYGR